MKVPIYVVVALPIVVLALAALVLRYNTVGEISILATILILFLAINFLNCYWEICLFFRRDLIQERSEYWKSWQQETGRSPVVGFLMSKISLTRALSVTTWADVWGAYACYDKAFAERNTFAFNVDVGNGFVTLIPTLVLLLAYALEFPSATWIGILGLVLYWQMTYMTSVYYLSFFVSGGQKFLGRRDLYVFIGLLNASWVIIPLLGLYVSLRMVLDANYSVLAF